MNRFDKSYRVIATHNSSQIVELFNLVNKLDTTELLQYSFTNQIPFDVINDNGDSLIHEVIRMDKRKTNDPSKLNIIKFLVQNGVNPDGPNKMNQTPLHLACSLQSESLVKYLLDVNVNPNYTDNLGLYPFHYLFSGEIKKINNTLDVLDFIDPPTKDKTDFFNKSDIIDIKQDIFDTVKLTPFIKSLKNTIMYLVEKEQTENNLLQLFANVTKEPSTADIIETIKSDNHGVFKTVKEKFENFDNIDYTFNRDNEDNDYKKSLKKQIKDCILDIKKTNQTFINKDYHNVPSTSTDIMTNDTASSYIKFEENIYIGGTRNIYIDNFHNLEPITNIEKILNYDTFGKQILYLLYNKFTDKQINTIYDLLNDNKINECLEYIIGNSIRSLYPSLTKFRDIDNESFVALYALNALKITQHITNISILKRVQDTIVTAKVKMTKVHGTTESVSTTTNTHINSSITTIISNLDKIISHIGYAIKSASKINTNITYDLKTQNDEINEALILKKRVIDSIQDVIKDIYKSKTLLNATELQDLSFTTIELLVIIEKELKILKTQEQQQLLIRQLPQQKQSYIRSILELLRVVRRQPLPPTVITIESEIAASDFVVRLMTTAGTSSQNAVVIADTATVQAGIATNSITGGDVTLALTTIETAIIEVTRATSYAELVLQEANNAMLLIKTTMLIPGMVITTELSSIINTIVSAIKTTKNISDINVETTTKISDALLAITNTITQLTPVEAIALTARLNISRPLLLGQTQDDLTRITAHAAVIAATAAVIATTSQTTTQDQLVSDTYKQDAVTKAKNAKANSDDAAAAVKVATKVVTVVIALSVQIGGVYNDTIVVNTVVQTAITSARAFVDIVTEITKIAYDEKIIEQDHIYMINFSLYIILGYTFINNKKHKDVIKSINNYLIHNKFNISDNDNFFKKWNSKLEGNKNIGLCIYDMYCDLTGLMSHNNLTSYVTFDLIALSTGINDLTDKDDQNELLQSVFNIYKPHIISKANNQRILKSLLLYFDDITIKSIDFYNNNDKPINTYETSNKMIKNFILLLDKYITDGDVKYDDLYKEFNKKFFDIKPYNVLQEICKELHGKIKNNKFLLQSLNDILYYIGKNNKAQFYDNLKNISILNFIDTNNNFNFDKYKTTEQPSFYNIEITDDSRHFIISHSMGLYYLNLINSTEIVDQVHSVPAIPVHNYFYSSKPSDYTLDMKKDGIYFTQNARIPTREKITETQNSKIVGYDKFIKEKLNKINLILDKLDKGKINNFNDIFNHHYIDIVKNCLLSKEIIDQPHIFNVNDLKKKLNTLNALLFIYYYFKDSTNTLLLSKFNKYLLDSSNKDIYYYTHRVPNTNDTIDIMTGGGIYDIDNKLYQNIHELAAIDIEKEIKLPQLLYNDLNIYYKMGIIKLFSDFIRNNGGILTKIKNYLKKNKTFTLKDENINSIKDNILYKLLCEVVKQELDVYTFNNILNKSVYKLDVDETLFKSKDMKINLLTTEISITDKSQTPKNVYSIIKKSKGSVPFIIYQNDFSNTSRLKIKNEFYVKEEIIDVLLHNNSLLFDANLDNIIPIYSLIKMNNNKIIKILKTTLGDKDIKLKECVGEKTIKFIKDECSNIFNKIFYNYNESNPINTIFHNINNNLFTDIKLLITSNENFGNNVLLYLENSFNICSYLTLHYLSNHLFDINAEYTLSNAKELYTSMSYEIEKIIENNYFEEQIESFEIDNNEDAFVSRKILNEKTNEIEINKENIIKLEKLLKSLDKTKISKNKSTELDAKIKEINDSNTSIEKENVILNKIIEKSEKLKKITKTSKTLIGVYDKYNKIYINDLWYKILKTNLKGNYNLIILELLKKQNENIDKTDNCIINNGFEHISNLCESYFNNKSFMNNNLVLKFINEQLNYLVRTIICQSIEYIMRKILHIYFSNSSNSGASSISTKIDYIIENEIQDIDKSIKQILYGDISVRLVKSSVSIFNDSSEQKLYANESVRDILSEFFNHLDIYGLLLTDNIKQVFKSNIVSYFDSFTSRTILLWLVNIENILKFFINNHRINDILSLTRN